MLEVRADGTTRDRLSKIPTTEIFDKILEEFFDHYI